MGYPLIGRIGQRIRETRRRQGLKLHEVAEVAQVSKGLLSRIENGRTVPSLPVLIAVIQALKVELSTFFEGLDMPSQAAFIHRKASEYEPFEKEQALGFLYHHILSRNVLNLALEAVILDLAPGSQRKKITTDGFEFKYVLKGEVTYQLGEETVVLRQGDSLFFNGKIPHVPINQTNEPASMLVIYLLIPPNSNGNGGENV